MGSSYLWSSLFLEVNANEGAAVLLPRTINASIAIKEVIGLMNADLVVEDLAVEVNPMTEEDILDHARPDHDITDPEVGVIQDQGEEVLGIRVEIVTYEKGDASFVKRKDISSESAQK